MKQKQNRVPLILSMLILWSLEHLKAFCKNHSGKNYCTERNKAKELQRKEVILTELSQPWTPSFVSQFKAVALKWILLLPSQDKLTGQSVISGLKSCHTQGQSFQVISYFIPPLKPNMRLRRRKEVKTKERWQINLLVEVWT